MPAALPPSGLFYFYSVDARTALPAEFWMCDCKIAQVIASVIAPFSYCMCDCMCIAYLLQLATVPSLKHAVAVLSLSPDLFFFFCISYSRDCYLENDGSPTMILRFDKL